MGKTEAIAWLGLSIALTGFLTLITGHILVAVGIAAGLAHILSLP